MNKKLTFIIVGVVIFLAAVGGGLYYAFGSKSSNTEEETTTKKRISEPENILPVAERPVIYIIPKADGHNLDIVIDTVKNNATEAEYTLEYQTGTLVQAQENVIELASLPVTESVFLGSCSAGGKCTFHEDIQGGSLRARFTGDKPYVLKQDWKYIDNKEGEAAFSSRDAKFQISSEDLADERYVVIYNSPGYPEGLEGTAVSDPYTLTGSSTIQGTGELTIRATEEGDLTIMGWDGTEWQEFTGTVDGKAVTAEVDLMQLYIAVKK